MDPLSGHCVCSRGRHRHNSAHIDIPRSSVITVTVQYMLYMMLN